MALRLLYIGDARSPHFRAWPAFFLRAGHDVHVCDLGGAAGRALDGGVWHPRPAAFRLPIRGAWRAAAYGIYRLAQDVQPDVVHTHQIIPTGYLASLARLAPHVATAWGSEVLLARRRHHALLRRVARQATVLTADSHHLLSVLERYGAPADRLRFVPWGVDPRWAEPARATPRHEAAARLGLPPNRPLVFAPRGTRSFYRPDVVIRAVARVRASIPDVLAVITCDRTPDAWPVTALQALADVLGAGTNVTLAPKLSHEEMPFAYRAASVCVSVSETDSAPTSVFEALALGVPTVVSDLPWVHEPVHREARLDVVPVGDDERLAEAIVERLTTPSSVDREVNRALVDRYFNRDRLFGEIGEVYEQLARRAQSPR